MKKIIIIISILSIFMYSCSSAKVVEHKPKKTYIQKKIYNKQFALV